MIRVMLILVFKIAYKGFFLKENLFSIFKNNNSYHEKIKEIKKIDLGVKQLTTSQLVQYGRSRKRRSYARISEVLELPNLIEIQTASYDWFLQEGLKEMFADISPIEDFTGNLSLEFIDYKL